MTENVPIRLNEYIWPIIKVIHNVCIRYYIRRRTYSTNRLQVGCVDVQDLQHLNASIPQPPHRTGRYRIIIIIILLLLLYTYLFEA